MLVARGLRSDIAVCGGDVSLPRSNQNEAEGRREPEIRGLFVHRKTSSQEIIESRCLGVRRSGSFRPPFIFIDAADEEPQDHDYHTQQGPERGHHEHTRAERGIEISEPA